MAKRTQFKRMSQEQMITLNDLLRAHCVAYIEEGVKTAQYEKGWDDRRILDQASKVDPFFNIGHVKNLRCAVYGMLPEKPPRASLTQGLKARVERLEALMARLVPAGD